MRRSSAARRLIRRAWRDARQARLAVTLRDAYLADDGFALAEVLGPAVCVVVDGGDDTAATALGIPAALTLLRRSLGAPAGLRLDVRPVNGRPGLLASRGGGAVAVVIPDGRRGAVAHVWVVIDPGKLARWTV
jgi:RNA polymerase sigma-70 factor (ECF subfamily)